MVEIGRITFTVVPTGVGRPDFSQNVELSVEPQIRSWQQEYQHFEEIDVPAGDTVQTVIEITSQTVVIVYDFYLSAPRNVLLHMKLEFLTAAGTWALLMENSGYQIVPIKYAKGFLLFRRYRVEITNYSEEDVTCRFSAHGTETEENIYYGEIVS